MATIARMLTGILTLMIVAILILTPILEGMTAVLRASMDAVIPVARGIMDDFNFFACSNAFFG